MDALGAMLLTAASFIVVLGIVVFVHEFGHFSAARFCRIAVKSFSIGMGPAIASVQDRHGTNWKIGAIPVGGFVSWVDDTDPSSTGPATAESQELTHEEARARGHFRAQPIASRAFVVAAGPVSNFIFAILAFAALLLIVGRDVTDRNTLSPRIDGVAAGSAAALAGIQAGDVVVAAGDQRVGNFGELQAVIESRPGQRMDLTVRRGEQTVTVPVTPTRASVTEPTGVTREVGRLGIMRETRADERVIERLGPLAALQAGAEQTWSIVTMTGAYVGNIITGRASAEHIAGPAGIFSESGRIANSAVSAGGGNDTIGEILARLGLSLLQWAAILSVAVGIVNLLPIPILDGGHLLFYLIEALRGGRPLPAQAQEWALRAGLAVLGSLFLFATWNDIQRIF